MSDEEILAYHREAVAVGLAQIKAGQVVGPFTREELKQFMGDWLQQTLENWDDNRVHD